MDPSSSFLPPKKRKEKEKEKKLKVSN